MPAAAAASPDAARDHVLAACEGVIDIAAILFNVSGKDLRSPRRSTLAVSRVRQIAMYAAHVRLGFTMGEVGLGFGRDRTTVLHACHQIEDLREDEEFDDIVARVEQVVAVAFGKRAQD
ncbi:MAG: chromosomal replication initiator DnaA [Aquamicrobium sp.]|uniref:helix-turn-helix domain-containing protein n=1 Tax=Aquamicrobium sp. TaxID=1872579 RepID=UPI00349E5656|nr:chromosomal replication initiator DnaA [Aquamicrobium sp.]